MVQSDGLRPQGGRSPDGKCQAVPQFQQIAGRVQVPPIGIDRHIIVNEIFPIFSSQNTVFFQSGLAAGDVGGGGIPADARPFHGIGVGMGFSFFQIRQRLVAAHVDGIVQADDAVLIFIQIVQFIISIIFTATIDMLAPDFCSSYDFAGSCIVDPHILIKADLSIKFL